MPKYDVKGPYKYEHDVWPCFRVVKDDYETYAIVFDNDGAGEERAELIAKKLNETVEPDTRTPLQRITSHY